MNGFSPSGPRVARTGVGICMPSAKCLVLVCLRAVTKCRELHTICQQSAKFRRAILTNCTSASCSKSEPLSSQKQDKKHGLELHHVSNAIGALFSPLFAPHPGEWRTRREIVRRQSICHPRKCAPRRHGIDDKTDGCANIASRDST